MKLRTVAVYALLLTVIPMYPAFSSETEQTALPPPAVSETDNFSPPGDEPESTESTNSPPPVNPDEPSNPGSLSEGSFLVLASASGEVMTLSEKDYVIGAVAAEMPALFEVEALKAQAVAAYTYAVRQRKIAQAAPLEELKGAYFSDDSTKYQAFYTTTQMKERFGENFDAYYEKIAGAVEAVSGEILVYGGEPIVAAFHSMSCGITESSQNIWGGSLPYLTAVDSKSDLSAPSYQCEYRYTADELKKTLKGFDLSGDPARWLEITSVSSSGTVLAMKIGSETITGVEMRELMGLRSAAFSIKYEDSLFILTTRGYGHGVGMSQYGANAMAQSGNGYRQILAHYYPGTEIYNNQQ